MAADTAAGAGWWKLTLKFSTSGAARFWYYVCSHLSSCHIINLLIFFISVKSSFPALSFGKWVRLQLARLSSSLPFLFFLFLFFPFSLEYNLSISLLYIDWMNKSR